MEKRIGLISIIFGSLVLSVEIYSLKFIQGFEIVKGVWFEDAFRYMTDPVVCISICITLIVILFGITLTLKK